MKNLNQLHGKLFLGFFYGGENVRWFGLRCLSDFRLVELLVGICCIRLSGKNSLGGGEGMNATARGVWRDRSFSSDKFTLDVATLLSCLLPHPSCALYYAIGNISCCLAVASEGKIVPKVNAQNFIK